MGRHQHRSAPCPAHGVAGQFAVLGVAATAVAVSARQVGMAAMRQARDDRAEALWGQRLQHARLPAATALSVARVNDLDSEVIRLRRAVESRDKLIRSISARG